MGEDDDEFEALYEGLDDESLAQVEVVATQQHQQSQLPPYPAGLPKSGHPFVGQQTDLASATKRRLHPEPDTSAPGFRTPVPGRIGRPSPGKRPKLDLILGPASTFTASQDDYETPEVIWTENGYVTHASSQSRSRGPGPNDFEVRHNGPGRPPALGAGYGKALHDDEADDWAITDPDAWDKAEEEAVRLSQRTVSPDRANQQRHLGTAARSARVGEPSRRPPGIPEEVPTSPKRHNEQPSEDGDVAKLRAEIEAMKAQLNLALNESKENKNRMYAREGEIKIVRERHDKVERELAEIRIQAQKQQEEFQRRLEERERTFAAEKERIDTQAAFHRLEHETSAKRTMWPGSARRRPPHGGFAASQSFSQAPYAPPPVMPTTPTRRNRGEPRTPSSKHRSGSQGQTNRSSTRRFEQEESPTRRARGRRDMSSGRPMAPPGPTPKRAAFPGFDNSFTADFSAPRKRPQPQPEEPPGGEDMMLVDGGDDTFGEAAPAAEDSSAQQTTPPVTDHPISYAEIRRQRYLWALSALSRRRASLVALLLSHFSDPPLAPLSLPRSRYLNSPLVGPKLVPTHPVTFHRLLDVMLPTGAHPHLAGQQRAATELLLGTMTEGVGGGDGPRRLALWAKEAPEQPPAQSKREELEDAAYWESQELIDESMQDLFEDLAVGLRTLAGIYLRICMMDALRDVFSLIYALSIAEPTIINYFTALDLPYQLISHAVIDDQQQSQPTQHASNRSQPPLPTQMNSLIVECVRKASRPLPLRISSHESVPVEPPNSGPPAGTQSRWARNKANKDAEAAQNEPWDMGTDQRNAALEGVLDLLEVFVWHMGSQCSRSLREVFEAPGFIVTFLDAERPASITRRFIRLLIQLAQYTDFWKCLVACSLDADVNPGLPALVKQSRTPLLELLSKQLVDLRSKESVSSAHRLHCGIITLLTQLVIKHDDALVLVRESKSVFAALVQSIHTDTSAIWNDDRLSRSRRGGRRGGQGHLSDLNADEPDKEDRVEDVVERIVADVRLLAQVYASEERADDLKQRLNSHEMHLLLNGIRHCFVLAFSRLAFAEEPAWMPEECVRELQSGVADRCSDLIEMVLSPDEVESVWEICAGDAGEGGEEDEHGDYDGEDEVMLEAHEREHEQHARRTHSAQEESQTQSEPSGNAR